MHDIGNDLNIPALFCEVNVFRYQSFIGVIQLRDVKNRMETYYHDLWQEMELKMASYLNKK